MQAWKKHQMNNKMHMQKILLSVFLVGLLGVASAQTQSQKLSNAERDYEEGRLTNIPQQLEEGLARKARDGGFSHEERIRAYKLLTKVYIFIDDELKSEQSLVSLLKEDKEHKLNPLEDPAELYFLYEKFRYKPIFRLGLRVGANKSFPYVLQTFSPSNTLQYKKIYNGRGDRYGTANPAGSLGLGYWAELMGERHLLWGVEAGTGFQVRNSRYDVDNYIGLSDGNEPTLVSFVSNQQLYLRFPLFLRYNYRYFSESGVIPYATSGFSYDYLMDAKYVEASRRGGTSYTLPNSNNNLKSTEMVNFHSASVFWAAGVKLRINTHFLTLECRYDKGLFNYINEENRWSGVPLFTSDLGFVEDDVALDMLSFSIGYTYSVYSPKKLKEFR